MATKKSQVVPQTHPVTQVRWRPGAVRPHPITNNSQAHAGVSPLDAIASRNTSFQPLPRPLGLPPYHYSLTDNFPQIAQNLEAAKKMVYHVLGDSGGIVDGEFQTTWLPR